eukprot:SAG31_NODE_41782_length_274_cov_0.891429_2_plen_23_part_01
MPHQHVLAAMVPIGRNVSVQHKI